jgi:osmotically-inducible protein OsmY
LVVIGVVAIFSVGCSSSQPRLTADEGIEDQRINLAVQSSLQGDSLVGSKPIEARTVYGVVWLTGFVDDESESRRAEELVMEVEGVRDFLNHIQLHSRE